MIRRRQPRATERAFTLIELMVAMVGGMFVSIAVFTLASLACALSQDLAGLTLARIAQGAGGAMMEPAGKCSKAPGDSWNGVKWSACEGCRV